MVRNGYNKFTKAYPKIAKGFRYAKGGIQLASQAYTMASTLAGIINSEKKYHDITITQIRPTSGLGSTLQLLTGVPKGDNTVSRDGESIALKTLNLKLHANFTDAAPDAAAARVVIFRCNDNMDGVTPSLTQILAPQPTVMTMRNLQFPKKFTVLFDKVFTKSNTNYNKIIEYYKKFKMMKDNKGNYTRVRHVTWTTDDGVTNDRIGKGHLFVLYITNVTTSGQVEFNGFSRIRYFDN